jgi:signal transduction histidine kinase
MAETYLQHTVATPRSLTVHDTLQGLVAAARELTRAQGAAICIPDGDPAAPDLTVAAAGGAAPGAGSRLSRADLPAGAAILPLPDSAAQDGAAPGYLVLFDPAGPVPGNDGALRALRAAAGFALQAAQALETGRRRLARALEAAEERARELDLVISQMVDGVVIADEHGELTRINPAGVAMLGRGVVPAPRSEYAAAYQIYTVAGQIYPWDELPLARAHRGLTTTNAELVVRHPDSSERILSVSAAPVYREDGAYSGAVAVMRDITLLKQGERLKDEFLSIVSHELRTPLSAILGYSDILLRGLHGALNERQARAQQGIRNNAGRLLRMINDLLDVSKLEAGSIPLAPAPLALAQAAAQATEAVQMLAAAANVHIRPEIPPDLPPVVADAERLQQIFANLLTNAIKFTPPGGQIMISARPSALLADAPAATADPTPAGPPHSVEVAVRDTGIGLTGDQPARIWERFYQADSTSSRRYGGAGLGLYIVRMLVELHGGAVWATSAGLNRGATIHFRLPVAGPAGTAEA